MNIDKIIENIGLGATIIANENYGYVPQLHPTTTQRNVTNYTDYIYKLLQGFIPYNLIKQSKSGIYVEQACKEQISLFINTDCPDKYFRFPLFNIHPQRVFLKFLRAYGNPSLAINEIKRLYSDCEPDIYNWAIIDSMVFQKTIEEMSNGKQLEFGSKKHEDNTPCFLKRKMPA